MGREGQTVRQRQWKARAERRKEWRGDWGDSWTARSNDPHGYRLLAYALLVFLFWFGFVVGCGAATWL